MNWIFFSTGQVFIYTQNESRQALEATNAQFSEQLSFLMDEETARQELAQVRIKKGLGYTIFINRMMS